jgi:hypothetical protein
VTCRGAAANDGPRCAIFRDGAELVINRIADVREAPDNCERDGRRKERDGGRPVDAARKKAERAAARERAHRPVAQHDAQPVVGLIDDVERGKAGREHEGGW